MESSSSSSNGPRPLATKPEYVRRSHTSKSGLLSSSTTPNTTPSNSNSTRHELDHFFFKRPVSDSLLQPNAKRARKVHRSILRDQYYLLDLKQMWQTKLKKLQMEQMLLEQMCAYTQEDVNDIPPLFSQNDSTPSSQQQPQQQQQQQQQRQSPFLQGQQHRLEMRQPEVQQQGQHDDAYALDLRTPASSAAQLESFPSSPHSSAYITADDVTSETNSFVDSGGRNTSKNSPIAPAMAETTILADEHASHPYVDDNDEDDEDDTNNNDNNNNSSSSNPEALLGLVDSGNDSNGEEDEDEETARRALTFMLAHYGNDL